MKKKFIAVLLAVSAVAAPTVVQAVPKTHRIIQLKKAETKADSYAEQSADSSAESMVESIPESMAESIPEPAVVVESVAEPVIEPVEAQPESVVESVVESMPESMVESIPEPAVVVESVAEPVIEPVEAQPESVVESIVESVAESMAESIPEPAVVVESVAEPVIEPVEAQPESVVESIVESVAESMAESIPEPAVVVESVAEPVIEPVEKMVVDAETAAALSKEEDRDSRIYEKEENGSFKTLLTTGNYRVGIDLPAGVYHMSTENGDGFVQILAEDSQKDYHFTLPPELNMDAISNTEVIINELTGGVPSSQNTPSAFLPFSKDSQSQSETEISEAHNIDLTEGMTLFVRSNLMLELDTSESLSCAFLKRVQDLDGVILVDSGIYTAGIDFPAGVYDIVPAGDQPVAVNVNTGSGTSLSAVISEKPLQDLEYTAETISLFRNASFEDDSVLETDGQIRLIPKVRKVR